MGSGVAVGGAGVIVGKETVDLGVLVANATGISVGGSPIVCMATAVAVSLAAVAALVGKI